jgi:hypothetical protein
MTPDTYWASFVTVVFKTGSVIHLDGIAIADASTTGPIGPNQLVEVATRVAGTEYQRMSIQLARGTHTIRSQEAADQGRSGAPFTILNYGYDNYVSYAYPGGMDFAQTSTYSNLPSFP